MTHFLAALGGALVGAAITVLGTAWFQLISSRQAHAIRVVQWFDQFDHDFTEMIGAGRAMAEGVSGDNWAGRLEVLRRRRLDAGIRLIESIGRRVLLAETIALYGRGEEHHLLENLRTRMDETYEMVPTGPVSIVDYIAACEEANSKIENELRPLLDSLSHRLLRDSVGERLRLFREGLSPRFPPDESSH
jgi:hypothetical protein